MFDGERGRFRPEQDSQVKRYYKGCAADLGETRGYFMGFFMGGKATPEGGDHSLLVRRDVECAVMQLPTHDSSPPHYHKQALEVTFCISGSLGLIVDGTDEVYLGPDEFIVIPPGTVLQNPENAPGTRIFVIKVPSVPGDKFYHTKQSTTPLGVGECFPAEGGLSAAKYEKIPRL